jgi:hypothetical protein
VTCAQKLSQSDSTAVSLCDCSVARSNSRFDIPWEQRFECVDGTFGTSTNVFKRYGRLCESTDTGDREEAERYLIHRLRELREIRVYGERPQRTFRNAVQKYLAENSAKKSIDRDAVALRDLAHRREVIAR